VNGFTTPWTGPTLVTEAEMTDRQSMPVLRRVDTRKQITYEKAYVLVRLRRQPVGIVEIPFAGSDLEPAAYFDRIAQVLGDEIHAAMPQHPQPDGKPDAASTVTVTPASPSESAPAGVAGQTEAAPFVSIVIGTRDRPDSLRMTLDGLLKLDYSAYEIIVVDNAPSDDRTWRLIESELQDDRVRYLREKLPGLSNARNRGIAEARGEMIAITDDDVLADRLWLTALVGGLKHGGPDRQVACVTGLLLPAELETPAQALLESYGGFNRGYQRRVYDLDRNHPGTFLYPYAAGMFGSGANMLFTREFLCKINGFDPALGAGTAARGGEDLAMFFKVITSGAQLVYEPGAILYHFHAREYEALRNQIYSYGVGLMAYIMKIIVDEPWRIVAIGLRLPAAVLHVFSPKSTKNVKKDGMYPAELNHLERIGMLHGPFLFLKSLRQSYRLYRRNKHPLC